MTVTYTCESLDGPPHGLRDRGVGGVGKIPLSIVTETNKVNKNVPYSRETDTSKVEESIPLSKV